MKGITIRFSDQTYEMLRAEARYEGVAITAYIREAALARAFVTRAQRGMYGNNDMLNQAIRIYLAENDLISGDAPEPPSADA